MSAPAVPEYRRALWDSRVQKLFDGDDREQVLSWLLEVGERKRVIVVGAGFSKNAQSRTGSAIPNWDELTARMARHLRLDTDKGHDPLELADLFETEHSRDALEDWLAQQLDDDALAPGAAHRALWESSPHAVITTNFLDTLLEKPISSVGVPIYECTQLAKRLSEVERHLIYFHGHRSAPETWVTSRQDYEDLPRKRPAIHIKVRQLLAEFPAVVVGYSMRDPDFHQIYRETARVLSDRHPPGLVVLPAEDEDPRLSQMRAQYWKALRVRFVRFRKDTPDVNVAYQEFFRLVELPESDTTLRSALVTAEGPSSSAQAFKANLRIAESALRDVLHLPFLARGTDELWKEALALALTKEARETAQRRQQESWKHYVAQRRVSSQRSSASGELEQAPLDEVPNPAEPHPLNISDWVPGVITPSDRQWQLLKALESHEDLVRIVEQALQAGADRQDICTWLGRYLDEDYAAPSRGERVARRMLALLTDSDPDHVTTADGPGRPTESPQPGDGRPWSSGSAQPSPVGLLVTARAEALSGNGDLARESYLRIARELGRDGRLREELSLQAYFAVRGAIAHHRWDEKAPPELSRQQQALEATLPVQVWRDRVRAAKDAAYRARTGRNGFRREREGYESRGWGFSNAPSSLRREFTYAEKIGAPLCVLYDLQVPLLGTFPSSGAELSQRLTYNLEKPGEWLKSELADRLFVTEPSASLGAPSPTKRENILRAIDLCMYPEGTLRTGIAGRAVLSVIANCPETTTQGHLQLAIEQLVSLDDSEEETLLAAAWTGLSETCSWHDVGQRLSRYVKGRERHHFRWRNLVIRLLRFPWRDWIVCDDFFNNEGEEFVTELVKMEEELWNDQVGWLLYRLRDLDPHNKIVRSLSVRWLAQTTTKDEIRFEAACALLSTFESCPKELTALWAQVQVALEAADCSQMSLVLRVAGSEHDTDLRRLARLRLSTLESKCFTTPSTSLHVRLATVFLELDALVVSNNKGHISERAQHRVLEILGTSWRPLPFVAELLRKSDWSPENWTRLLTLLAVGDDGRARNEWRLQRINLLLQSLSVGGEPLALFLSGVQPFRNIRESVPRAVVEADQEAAIQAMLALPNLFLVTSDREEQLDLLRVLEVASKDERILVAKEAAYTATFLLAHNTLLKEDRERLEGLRNSLSSDPCAAILRQLDVGTAVGKRHAKKTPNRNAK